VIRLPKRTYQKIFQVFLPTPALPTNREGLDPTENEHLDNHWHPERKGPPPTRRGIEGVKEGLKIILGLMGTNQARRAYKASNINRTYQAHNVEQK